MSSLKSLFAFGESSTSPSPALVENSVLVENRAVTPGRYVLFNSNQHVYERLVLHGWINLCIIPTPCYPDLVREFFANALTPVPQTKTIFSRVKGCPICITVDEIAKSFNLNTRSSFYYPLRLEDLSTLLPLIVSALTGHKDSDSLEVKFNDLTDEYRFLYEIAIANLISSTRSSIIPVDVCTFLYTVMSGRSLDLASMIWDAIADSIKSIGSSWSPLPFGSLISHILFKQLVQIPYDEIPSRPIDPIGSVKMIYKDMSDCHSFGDIGICLSRMSKNLHKDINRISSRLDRFESLSNSLKTLHSRVDTQAGVFKKLVNGGFLSYEEEAEIERPKADD